MKTSILAIVLALLCGCAAQPMQHGIPNFRMVEPGVYRGGQPTAEGWVYLHAVLHVKTVVKLNSYGEGSSDNIATALGMQVYCHPISLWQQIVGEPDKGVLTTSWFEMVPWNGPVFVHCSHGQDRTGLVTAIYRVNMDHWTKARAEQEMLKDGFHPLLHGLYGAWQEWGN